MTGQQLKNSILQMAVQGKLVPQDPNEEPASVLLERIRAEKEQLIREGKIKREKNLSVIFRGSDNLPYEKIGDNEPVCIADEVPFDIPESWEWTRVSTISTVVTKGTTPRGGNIAYLDSGVGFLRAENVSGVDSLNLSNLKHIDLNTHLDFLKRSILEANDILITIAGTLGRTAIVREKDLPLNANQAVAIIRLVDCKAIDLRYLVYALNAPLIQEVLTAQKKITAIPNLTLEIISDCVLPIPPLAEQKRVVAKIKELLPYIDKYGEAESEVNTLNTTFPETLKKSILQWAVQGKLVPQDPNDEPASVLLERIRSEKERLIKEGKIKRDKHESVIFRRDNSYYEKVDGIERCIDDELPFEIPDNWAWARLNILTIKEIRRGKSPKYSDTGTVYVFAQKCNVKLGGIDISLAKKIDMSTFSRYSKEEYMIDGDIVINSTGNGTLGRVGIFHDTDRTTDCIIVPDSHVTIVRICKQFKVDFLYYVLKYYQPYLERMGEGSTNQTELRPSTVAELFIPVPPNYGAKAYCC